MPAQVGETPRILVVDDEVENCELLARALRPYAEVEICLDGAAAVRRASEEQFIAVIADHNMPGMTGVRLLERLATESPHSVRVLVTAHATTEVLKSAINLGHVEHCFTKPFDLEELARVVERLVSDSRALSVRRALVWVGLDVLETVRNVLTAMEMPFDVASEFPGVGARWSELGLVVWDSAIGGDCRQRLADLRSQLPEAALVCIVDRRGPAPNVPLMVEEGLDEAVWRPVLPDELEVRVRRALDRRRPAAETRRAQRPRSQYGLHQLLGRSPQMLRVFRTIEQVAPTDATVLIRGETGTGKELVARMLHELSGRNRMPFVAVNCAALPETLVESELFGHERGAFTGANSRRPGRFEIAKGGTIFIDEVGDLPLSVQVKLLRVLEERTFERVGGNEMLHADIRILAATHRDLEQMVAEHAFREDLFYRLNVVPILVPPLRKRPEDIWLIAQHYLEESGKRMHKEGIHFSEAARRALEKHSWQGNVRELINIVERVVALTPSYGTAEVPTLGGSEAEVILPAVQAPVTTTRKTLKEQVRSYERTLIAEALARAGGNRSKAARELGLTRQGLSLKLAK